MLAKLRGRRETEEEVDVCGAVEVMVSSTLTAGGALRAREDRKTLNFRT